MNDCSFFLLVTGGENQAADNLPPKVKGGKQAERQITVCRSRQGKYIIMLTVGRAVASIDRDRHGGLVAKASAS